MPHEGLDNLVRIGVLKEETPATGEVAGLDPIGIGATERREKQRSEYRVPFRLGV